MQKKVVAILVIVLISVVGFLSWKYGIGMFMSKPNDKAEGVYLSVTSATKQRISFTVYNNTQEKIAIYPNSCASQTVDLFGILNNNPEKIELATFICAMVVDPFEVNQFSQYSGELEIEKYVEKLQYPQYLIELSYGKKTEKFRMTDMKSVRSETFILQ